MLVMSIKEYNKSREICFVTLTVRVAAASKLVIQTPRISVRLVQVIKVTSLDKIQMCVCMYVYAYAYVHIYRLVMGHTCCSPKVKELKLNSCGNRTE
ncbi:hypothetical protein HanIR_Chr11g0512741 [Helianthus annuus]|nr:hypothetical protein HanIR_Chr11g0512741 [Helianthus annuus]